MMNDKPILFSGEMVRAILDGRKTQTRRVIKPQPPFDFRSLMLAYGGMQNIPTCPYSIGQRLWVRETWGAWPHMGGGVQVDSLRFRADGEYQNEHNAWRWRPSIHMPRWASRITLGVTNVRVERVQEISEEDAKAEGATAHAYSWPEGTLSTNAMDCGGVYRNGFRNLWDSINAKRGFGWDTNCWVWVIEFKRVQP